MLVDGIERRLRITDTPGMSSPYAALINQAILTAEGFVLVYSMTDQNSFQKIRPLYDQILRTKKWEGIERPPVAIVATKRDLEAFRLMSSALPFSLAEDLDCAFFECSAKSENSVLQPFTEVVRRIGPKGSTPCITVSPRIAFRKAVSNTLSI
jgi:GTPase SAR1 family protein